MRRRNLLWLLLLPALWFALYEPREIVVHGTPPLQVRANEHAAATRLLEQWGLETSRVLSPGALFPLPDTDSLLILTGQRGALGAERGQQLRDWVDRGGQLLVVARPLPRGQDPETVDAAVWHDHDPLLFPLGVTAWRTEAPEPRPTAPELLEQYLDAGVLFQRLCINPSADMEAECADVMCRHHRPWHDSRWVAGGGIRRFGLEAGVALRHPALDTEGLIPTPDTPHATSLSFGAENEWGHQLLALSTGEGRLLVLTGLDIWNNEQLHLLDHAWLLREASRDASRVWFVQNLDMPPLGRWLWQQAWPLIIALALALALFLWNRIPREGARLDGTTGGGRDFLEHLLAASRFRWRTGNRDALLAPLRRQVEARLARHPIPAGRDQRLRYLARHTGTDREAIARALTTRPESQDELIEFIATLQMLRSRL